MKLVEQLRALKADKIPAGWLTIDQLAHAEGLVHARGGFQYTVKAAVEARLLQRKKYLVATGGGLRKVWHYKRVK